jgi:ABC-2 type transport system ATP-binding protein
MTEPVRTERLTKRYGRIVAVEDLDLTVHPGEVYGFLGPNGAGKTTTLRMLLGLTRPSAGGLRLFGRPPGAGYLERVGALIEGPAFYPYLSGRQNLLVMAGHAGVSRNRVDAVLETVDLTARAKDRYRTYSLGMKQRLGLAAALLKDPRLLILDEPANGLDPAGMADLRVLIRALAADAVTVLLSSHVLSEVEQICDRVGMIARGRLVTETTVASLRTGGALRVVATPIEDAAARLRARFGADAVRIDGTALDLEADEPAGRVNAELVAAGITVSELRRQERGLEEIFLELTGGEHRDR